MKYAQKLAEAYIRHQVKDPATANKLIPNYIMGCKRILVSNKYYPSFNRKNVELVTNDILELTRTVSSPKMGRSVQLTASSMVQVL